MSKTIMETVEFVNSVLKKQYRDIYQDIKFGLIFGKNGAPYLVKATRVSREDIINDITELDNEKIVCSYKIFLYAVSPNLDVKKIKSAMAECKFYISDVDKTKRLSYLSLLHVADKKHAHNGLGTELLNIMTYFSEHEKATQVEGVASAFSYLSQEKLVDFYTKNDFNFHRNKMAFAKFISGKKVEDFKKRVINFPGENITLTVAVPKERIAGSDFKNSRTQIIESILNRSKFRDENINDTGLEKKF